MTTTPLLEDLRRWAAPTWLWDAARGRIVWANAAGIAAFDCDTLFDLIDKPFDQRESGVETIAALGRQLVQGVPQDVLLTFAHDGAGEAFNGKAYLHPLADGRPGVLVVIDLPPEAVVVDEPTPTPTTAPSLSVLLNALPHAAAICDETFTFVARNPQMEMSIPGEELSAVLMGGSRLERIQQRLQHNSVTSSIEIVHTSQGQREYRVTLSKLNDSSNHLLLLMEDVTERRALERQLSALADAPAPVTPAPAPKPTFTSAEQVFAEIGRQLTNRLAPDKPLDDVPAEPTVAAVATPPAVTVPPPTIPDAVRAALEQASAGIAICQQGVPVYVTQKALDVLGFNSSTSAMAKSPFWDDLKDMKAGSQRCITAPNGDSLLVTTMPMPWQNGRAEQFAFSRAAPRIADNPEPSLPPEIQKAEKEPAAAPLATTDTIPADDGLEQELKAILDVVSDGIITLNDAGNILTFSAGAEAIFGARAGDAIGRPMADFLAQDSRKTWRDYLRSLSGPGLGTVFNDGREMLARHTQGGEHPLFISVSRLQTPQSKAAFCVLVRDISPWKKTERELTEAKERAEQANRRKSEFIAHISHELRTPLNAILGFSDVMRGERLGSFGNSKYLAYANDIHSSGTHLLAIINDLLDLAKVEAGKLELNFTAVNLEETADYVLRMTREDAAAAHVIVRRSIPQNLPRVVADIKSLRQVLLNLVSNAIKFTDAGGEVLISAGVDGTGALCLRVKDTGVGMTMAELEAALKPFGRVEDADRPRPGTGLGLPLTKSLVEANRAQLQLHSEPGRGTLAEITFPGPRVLAE